ncbi:hypothetical protein [Lacinutrix sp. Bg11-31]|uniref:hypothetical protein n=1 Tax=Lacinutrix sp. Bg11-31 TaxID=2057808 RepID=UPI000C304A3C|nr:hypothetical protein [Lacinutrix sp. Bg11-31]AUC80937.1 hypothetical protein CW733_01825 [Lacinutrix sp. Bg11-31]
MKTQENEFFIDKIITKYQSLSKKEKSNINLCLALIFTVFIIGQLYNGGEVFGAFLYNISH